MIYRSPSEKVQRGSRHEEKGRCRRRASLQKEKYSLSFEMKGAKRVKKGK